MSVRRLASEGSVLRTVSTSDISAFTAMVLPRRRP
jgi:hypothetical protein